MGLKSFFRKMAGLFKKEEPVAKTYSVLLIPCDGGYVQPWAYEAKEGELVELTVYSEEKYHLVSIDVVDENGVEVSLDSGCSCGDGKCNFAFSMPAGNVVIESVFEQDRFVIECRNGEGGVVKCNEFAAQGEIVCVNVKPNKGYKVDTVLVNTEEGNVSGVKRGKGNQYSFTMPANDVCVDVSFNKSMRGRKKE